MLRSSLFLLDDDFDELDYVRQRSRAERRDQRQLGLVIAPTMGCNLHCHYCFERHVDGAMGSAVRDKLLALVAARLPDYESLAVQWFGGEPLRGLDAMRDISRGLLALCAAAGKAYAATVITNGTLMTAEVAHELVRLGVAEVQITLDGDQPLHDRTRREGDGTGSFERILANMRAAPDDLAINVRVHLAPFSRNSVLALLDRMAAEGMAERIHTIYFAPLFNYRVGMADRPYQPDGRRFATAEEFSRMEIEALRKAHGLGFRLKDFLDVSYGVCTAVREHTLVVDPSGNLTKCYKDIGVAAERIGTVDTGLADEARLERWHAESVPRDTECGACRFLPLCLSGCAKQWHEGADKSVICTPLRYNAEDRIRLLFEDA